MSLLFIRKKEVIFIKSHLFAMNSKAEIVLLKFPIILILDVLMKVFLGDDTNDVDDYGGFTSRHISQSFLKNREL